MLLSAIKHVKISNYLGQTELEGLPADNINEGLTQFSPQPGFEVRHDTKLQKAEQTEGGNVLEYGMGGLCE